jgi:hypothetical protein
MLEASLALEVDFPQGQVTATDGFLKTYNPHTKSWCMVLEPKGELLMRFAPCGGAIGMRFQVDPADMDFNHPYGPLRLATPNVLRFFVGDEPRAISNIGQMVKRRLFPKHPGFVFNTVAYVGSPGPDNVGKYTDPESPWFNIFVGYYQIDAPIAAGWDRPFGYERNGYAVHKQDLIRLGKADWNWFSNWNYGTPAEEIEAYDEIDATAAGIEQSDAVQIGTTWWHPVAIGAVEVASTYESYFPEAAKLVRNSPFLTDLWRAFFGLPCPCSSQPTSFIPTTLRGSLFMAFQKDDVAYHTRIFGGTLEAADKTDKDGFLAAQMGALENLIAKQYGDLGFEGQPPAMPPAVVPSGVGEHQPAEPAGVDVVRPRILGSSESAAAEKEAGSSDPGAGG